MTSTSCCLLLLMLCSGLAETSLHGSWSPSLAMKGLHQFANTDQQAEKGHFPCCPKSQGSNLPHHGSLHPEVLLAASLAVLPLHHRDQAFLSLQDLCKDPVTLMFILPASAVCSLPPQLLHLPNQHLRQCSPPTREPTITPSLRRGTSLSLQLQTTGASPFNEGPTNWETANRSS